MSIRKWNQWGVMSMRQWNQWDVMSIRKWNQWYVMSIRSAINEMSCQLESETNEMWCQLESEINEMWCQLESEINEMWFTTQMMWLEVRWRCFTMETAVVGRESRICEMAGAGYVRANLAPPVQRWFRVRVVETDVRKFLGNASAVC